MKKMLGLLFGLLFLVLSMGTAQAQPTMSADAMRVAHVLSQSIAPVVQQVEPGCVYTGGGWACGGAFPFPSVMVERIAGEHRYATAVEISKVAFPEGSGVLYVASGSNFPDALTGGFAFAGDGPLLLLPGNGYDVPTVVYEEVARLNPDLIVVLGGVISEDQIGILEHAANQQ